ncbi:MAG: hypothetical protein NTV57_03730 [Cyanobacteria bacterium]|nr:hypothetical protein [Cyanobacteriota bacterium]
MTLQRPGPAQARGMNGAPIIQVNAIALLPGIGDLGGQISSCFKDMDDSELRALAHHQARADNDL